LQLKNVLIVVINKLIGTSDSKNHPIFYGVNT
jgi:hypothetical protein